MTKSRIEVLNNMTTENLVAKLPYAKNIVKMTYRIWQQSIVDFERLKEAAPHGELGQEYQAEYELDLEYQEFCIEYGELNYQDAVLMVSEIEKIVHDRDCSPE